ncbi:MAG: C45 family peptidase [Chloroflexota bacterium]
MSLPYLRLTGTPYQQGVQHGKALYGQIEHNLAIYLNYIKQAGLLQAKVVELAEQYKRIIATQNPSYYQNMQGIAAGSAIPMTNIIILNIRYELIYYIFALDMMNKTKQVPIRGSDGCTAFAVRKSAPNNHLLIGQTWDWLAGIEGALLHTEEQDGLQTLAFSEAGIVGAKIGFNSARLGLAINGLNTTSDSLTSVTKPFHVRCYEILRQSTIDAAKEIVIQSNRTGSANFLMAQPPDHLVNIETSSTKANLHGWQDGLFVHTNNFLAPEKLGIEEPDPEYIETSQTRCTRLDRLLRTKSPTDIDTIQDYLRDHTNQPESICAHKNPKWPSYMRTCTLVSVVMDLHQREMYLADGQPCKSTYQRYQL